MENGGGRQRSICTTSILTYYEHTLNAGNPILPMGEEHCVNRYGYFLPTDIKCSSTPRCPRLPWQGASANKDIPNIVENASYGVARQSAESAGSRWIRSAQGAPKGTLPPSQDF